MYKRNCPTCNEVLEYKSKEGFDLSTKRNSECRKCNGKTQSKLTQIKMKESGTEVWNKGLTKHTNETLAKLAANRQGDNNPAKRAILEGRSEPWLKGKTMEELKGKEYADDWKGRIRDSVCKQYKDGRTKNVDTKPEREFKQLLKDNNIQYEQTFYLDKKFYDFYLADYNTLVEVDGTYWHGKGLEDNELNETQTKNRKNDKLKNKIAEYNGYMLIRVWGDEINKFNINKLKVIK